MRIVWSPRALDRVSEAASFIARDKPDAAEQWVDDLFAAVARLARFPELGRTVPEVKRPEIRQITVGIYRVIYRVAGGKVAVLTVHGRRLFDPAEVEPP